MKHFSFTRRVYLWKGVPNQEYALVTMVTGAKSIGAVSDEFSAVSAWRVKFTGSQ